MWDAFSYLCYLNVTLPRPPMCFIMERNPFWTSKLFLKLEPFIVLATSNMLAFEMRCIFISLPSLHHFATTGTVLHNGMELILKKQTFYKVEAAWHLSGNQCCHIKIESSLQKWWHCLHDRTPNGFNLSFCAFPIHFFYNVLKVR